MQTLNGFSSLISNPRYTFASLCWKVFRDHAWAVSLSSPCFTGWRSWYMCAVPSGYGCSPTSFEQHVVLCANELFLLTGWIETNIARLYLPAVIL